MTNQHEIISLDPTKTWCERLDGRFVFKKITNKEEVDLLRYAHDVLNGKKIVTSRQIFSINVPEVLDWDNQASLLTMSYCEGENLECLLCTSSTRAFAVDLLQALLKFIIANHFFWYDFAPRNILVGSNAIYFVDFEKGIDNSIKHIKPFLRNHVYEEYSSFLLKSERLFEADYVYSLYDGETDITIYISDIKVKRFKAVALQLGFTDTILLSELLKIQHMIINAEEPYMSDDGIIFPRVKLVKMLEDKLKNPQVYVDYAKLIVKASEV